MEATYSRTARAMAVHRAVHQLVEQGSIFSDPLAIPILQEDPQALVPEMESNPFNRVLRFFGVSRARIAEERIMGAIERGARQVIILGAGLDTFALRQRAEGVRVFEVDHPATQEWKRSQMKQAGLELPQNAELVPLDLEQCSLEEGLRATSFHLDVPTAFSWMGAVDYLHPRAFWSSMDFFGGLAGGAALVFDYNNPPESLPPELRALHEKGAAQAAALGEPWQTYLDTEELMEELKRRRFREIADLDLPMLVKRFLPAGTPLPPRPGRHILSASTLA